VVKGQQTFGGYTDKMVVHWRFAIKIPESYPLPAAGPVMCSGVTMYDPMKKHGVKMGSRVGIVGLGGLGLMGVKLARALGAEVTAISQSKGKEALARSSGAQSFIVASSPADMEAAKGSLDLILNTVPAYHDYGMYAPLLRPGGKQVLLGAHAGLMGAMLTSNCKCFGCLGEPTTVHSVIGGIKNTQEVIDLCAKADIVPEFKVVPVTEISRVYEELDRANQTGLRYVLDIANTLNAETAEKCTASPPQLAPSQAGTSKRTILYEVFRQLGVRAFRCVDRR
jgi:D-arabinose 1-dehydrogenase-like Zn-dependent alcohol dehydrogenase